MYEIVLERHLPAIFYKDEHGFLRNVVDPVHYLRFNSSWFGQAPNCTNVGNSVFCKYKEDTLPDGTKVRNYGPERITIPLTRMLKKDLKEFLLAHILVVEENLGDLPDHNLFIVRKEDVEPGTYDVGILAYDAKAEKEL